MGSMTYTRFLLRERERESSCLCVFFYFIFFYFSPKPTLDMVFHLVGAVVTHTGGQRFLAVKHIISQHFGFSLEEFQYLVLFQVTEAAHHEVPLPNVLDMGERSTHTRKCHDETQTRERVLRQPSVERRKNYQANGQGLLWPKKKIKKKCI